MTFNVIKSDLIDPTHLGSEKRAIMAADMAKARSYCAKIEVVNGIITLLAMPMSLVYPILGSLYTCVNVLATLAAHEAKVIMKNGQGKEIPVLTVNNERLNLGKEVLLDIPVQLLATGNPARFKTHILGNEVLKRFNTILDFQNNFVYLKKDSLFDLPYKDSK